MHVASELSELIKYPLISREDAPLRHLGFFLSGMQSKGQNFAHLLVASDIRARAHHWLHLSLGLVHLDSIDNAKKQ